MLLNAIKFVIVGVLAACAHFFVALLSEHLLEGRVQIANTLGFVCGFIVSYVGHALFTFKSSITLKNLMQYASLGTLNWLISAVGIEWLTHIMPFTWAMLLVVISLPIINFFISRVLIFKRRHSAS
ncbi:GtrA family protein [Agaribacterium haliotis]|uniref:GtrA family protein n=1 Tax=Agaribacterium haliotis TaxID=2013869 RepID=UPI000BB554E8